MEGLYTATDAWQNATLSADTVIQCRQGPVLISTAGSDPTDGAGHILDTMDSVAIVSGKTVRYKALTPAGGTLNATAV